MAFINGKWTQIVSQNLTSDAPNVTKVRINRRMTMADETAFNAFMLAYHEHGPTGLGFRKCLEAYDAAKASQPAQGMVNEQPVKFTPVRDDKLIALLEKLCCLGNGSLPGNSIGNTMAQEALEMAKNPPYATREQQSGDLATPKAEPVEQSIIKALHNHTMKHSFFGFDAPLPLVDMLCPKDDTNIERGMEELDHLVESICEAINFTPERKPIAPHQVEEKVAEQPDELPWCLRNLFHEKINSICEDESHALDCADKIVALIEEHWPKAPMQESGDVSDIDKKFCEAYSNACLDYNPTSVEIMHDEFSRILREYRTFIALSKKSLRLLRYIDENVAIKGNQVLMVHDLIAKLQSATGIGKLNPTHR